MPPFDFTTSRRVVGDRAPRPVHLSLHLSSDLQILVVYLHYVHAQLMSNGGAVTPRPCGRQALWQGCRGDWILIPIPIPYPYPWESPWESPYPRQHCLVDLATSLRHQIRMYLLKLVCANTQLSHLSNQQLHYPAATAAASHPVQIHFASTALHHTARIRFHLTAYISLLGYCTAGLLSRYWLKKTLSKLSDRKCHYAQLSRMRLKPNHQYGRLDSRTSLYVPSTYWAF